MPPPLWARIAVTAGKVVLFGHTFVSYVGHPGPAVGISMMPTIPTSEHRPPWVLLSRLHRRGRYLKVGDVITFSHPMLPDKHGVKRIVGMPGDFVSVVTAARGEDDLNAVDADDRWASLKDEVIRVPEGHCWVAGDNLEWSRDSRTFGPLPLGLVKAKVYAVILPYRDMKWMGSDVDIKDVKEGEKEWVLQ